LRDTQADSVIIATKKSTSGRLLPIVHALQKEFGYIDEAAELLIAEALNISRAEVHGVISFYHTRAPAGRHVVKLCRGEACHVADGDPFAKRAEAGLGVLMGTTTRDGGVTLESVYCAVAPRLQAAE
jgi:formate dehydrogenase subunit gamma